MAAAFIQKEINEHKVVIFSKSFCPFCKKAKKCFDTLKEPYTAIELDERDDGDAIQDALNALTGSRTVPKTFINGKCYGGGDDIKDLLDKGELKNILKL